jgi:hypothetical protein
MCRLRQNTTRITQTHQHTATTTDYRVYQLSRSHLEHAHSIVGTARRHLRSRVCERTHKHTRAFARAHDVHWEQNQATKLISRAFASPCTRAHARSMKRHITSRHCRTRSACHYADPTPTPPSRYRPLPPLIHRSVTSDTFKRK